MEEIDNVDISIINSTGACIKLGELVGFEFSNALLGYLYFRLVVKVKIPEREYLELIAKMGAMEFIDSERLIMCGGSSNYLLFQIRFDYVLTKFQVTFNQSHGLFIPMKKSEFWSLKPGDTFMAEIDFNPREKGIMVQNES